MHQLQGAKEIPFPPELFTMYPERVELVGLLDTTAPISWPKRRDSLPSAAGWLAIVRCLQQSTQAALIHEDKVVRPIERQLLRSWTATCFTDLTTQAAGAWHNAATRFQQQAMARVVNAIYAEASWYGDTRGAIYTIRHLVSSVALFYLPRSVLILIRPAL